MLLLQIPQAQVGVYWKSCRPP